METTWRQNIWSGLGKPVFSYPQANRKFFSNFSFGETEDLRFFIFIGIYNLHPFPVLKLEWTIRVSKIFSNTFIYRLTQIYKSYTSSFCFCFDTNSFSKT